MLAVVEQQASQGNGTALTILNSTCCCMICKHVLALIDGLPLKQKAALIQRKLHGCPYDTIAVSLQCSPEAARAHVFQALKKIRAELALPPHMVAAQRVGQTLSGQRETCYEASTTPLPLWLP